MRRIDITASSGAPVIAIAESLSRLPEYVGAAKGVIVTDRVVRRLHGKAFPQWEVIEIGAGEGSKTLGAVAGIYKEFLRHGVDRVTCVVAIGGGIVCDVAGFAASTYLRGLRFGFAPTTLLAQVDASVGGKNGVNLDGYKNLIGTFTQPAFVLCDLDLLGTLPERELQNGFAEVVKQAAVGDENLFSFLEAHREKALRLDRDVIGHIVHGCLTVKGAIVSRDERESGVRRTLNFGHTIGHAVEKAYHVDHGRAIGLGMVAASKLSVAKGLLSQDDAARIEALLSSFGLPVAMEMDSRALGDALEKDKKREGGLIHFVLLEGIGRARVVPIALDALREVIDDLCQPR
ncbi:MAG: 3-dehydroquinate synthase [Syntrophorhabdales bacterium]|jgi:3-dehydroquinate synthase